MAGRKPTAGKKAAAKKAPAAIANRVQWFKGRDGVLRAATNASELALFGSRPGWKKVQAATAEAEIRRGEQQALNEARAAEDAVRAEQQRAAEAEQRRRDRTQVVIVPESAVQKPDQPQGGQS